MSVLVNATNDTNEAQRQRQVKRNIRRTAAALWLTVIAIFVYILAKYYWLNA